MQKLQLFNESSIQETWDGIVSNLMQVVQRKSPLVADVLYRCLLLFIGGSNMLELNMQAFCCPPYGQPSDQRVGRPDFWTVARRAARVTTIGWWSGNF